MINLVKDRIESVVPEIRVKTIRIKEIEENVDKNVLEYIFQYNSLIRKISFLIDPIKAKQELRAKYYRDIINNIRQDLPSFVFMIPTIVSLSNSRYKIDGELPIELIKSSKVTYIDVIPHTRQRIDLEYVSENDIKILYMFPGFIARYELFKDPEELGNIRAKIQEYYMEIADMVKDLILEYKDAKNRSIAIYMITR